MNESKRQILPAGLWVVATPIGNLMDLTPRARDALECADAIYCEDTRRTSQLLTALAIVPRGRLERLDAHAGSERITQVIERLASGASFALVTDAGTPAISDPGAVLVAAAHEAGVQVTPVPGVSAVAALLSVAGFLETSFAFRGFFPRKDSDRVRELAAVQAGSSISRVFVWYESPQRISEALSVIAEKLPESRVFAGKELTKLHERYFQGTAVDAAAAVNAEIQTEGPLGEWCFALHLPEPVVGESAAENSADSSANSSEWVKALRCMLDAQVSASEAAKRVSQYFGIAKNSVYEMALRLSGKK